MVQSKKELIGLSIGLGLISVAVILFGLSMTQALQIQAFQLILNPDYPEVTLDITFIVSILMIIIAIPFILRFLPKDANETGNIFISAQVLQEELQEINANDSKFNSITIKNIPWMRILAAMLMIVMGIINFTKYGIGIVVSDEGNWFMLGGFTMFVPMSLLPMIFALLILLSSLFTSGKDILIQSKEELQIYELRLLGRRRTTIPITKVKGLQISDRKMSYRIAWFIPMTLIIVLQIIDGLALAYSPNAFGAGIRTGNQYLITATTNLIAMILLLIFTPTRMEINTESQNIILEIFGSTHCASILTQNLANSWKMQISDEVKYSSMKKYPHPKLYLFIGLIFYSIAIISRISQYYAGDAFRMGLFIFGTYLLLKFYKETRKEEFYILLPSMKTGESLMNEEIITKWSSTTYHWFETVMLGIMGTLIAMDLLSWIRFAVPAFSVRGEFYISLLLDLVMMGILGAFILLPKQFGQNEEISKEIKISKIFHELPRLKQKQVIIEFVIVIIGALIGAIIVFS